MPSVECKPTNLFVKHESLHSSILQLAGLIWTPVTNVIVCFPIHFKVHHVPDTLNYTLEKEHHLTAEVDVEIEGGDL